MLLPVVVSRSSLKVEEPVFKPVADNIVFWGEYIGHREGRQEAGGNCIIQNVLVCVLLTGLCYGDRIKREWDGRNM
jgi:hypothetical protein